jgi:hypothetical protein
MNWEWNGAWSRSVLRPPMDSAPDYILHYSRDTGTINSEYYRHSTRRPSRSSGFDVLEIFWVNQQSPAPQHQSSSGYIRRDDSSNTHPSTSPRYHYIRSCLEAGGKHALRLGELVEALQLLVTLHRCLLTSQSKENCSGVRVRLRRLNCNSRGGGLAICSQ